MKRWMTSLAPNRRTKFVSFTSRLLGKCPQGGSGRLQGRAGRAGAGQVLSALLMGQCLRAGRSRGQRGFPRPKGP